MKNKLTTIVVSVIVLVIILAGAWLVAPKSPKYCFDFVHDTQFGDREVKKPSNSGFMGNRGIMYYINEVKALQTVLEKEGFYIDPLEKTGGEIYMGPFWGPSTRGAVISYQKKYGLEATAVVDNETIDALALKYSCPKIIEVSASSTTATFSTSTNK
jgi:hypothetical protein